MKPLVWVPIESLDLRYTKQWAEWFPKVFEKYGIPYTTIDPDMEMPQLKTHNFLDPTGTMNYKAMQLFRIYNYMRQNHNEPMNLLFGDIWFPGIEGIKYISEMEKWENQPDIYGILHAGSYDEWDLTGMNGIDYWAKFSEKAMFAVTKKIFVGSKHHQNMVCTRRNIKPNKVSVTNNPAAVNIVYKIQERVAAKDRKGILFCGRLSNDKGLDVVQAVLGSGFPVTITRGMNLPKKKYYELMCRSKVIFAPSRHENFGLSIIEGMAAGCIPIVPNSLVFPEYVPAECRYSSVQELFRLLNNPPEYTSEELYNMVRNFDWSVVIPRMLKEMGYKI